ncbi:anti-repressor SinI [Scopulibacillus darangshiensis]|uniref:Anti-repressor SinI n=1 Tax=Scopulibacillus darangshiensis TaxID=442528 RepID=A0A4R2P693_9BACL|nr:helix-turn-helix domain-containing protein [Scopulibacillus darangshiensis]TCP30237.1 anti-repressor SinI [Scopulibacillus darangshiensis]
MLGIQIKNKRLDKGLSISRLAALSGISKGYLSKIERQKANPSAHIIQQLSEVLNVPVEMILKGKKDELDHDWVHLIQQAKELGVSKDEVKLFLDFKNWQQIDKEEEMK